MHSDKSSMIDNNSPFNHFRCALIPAISLSGDARKRCLNLISYIVMLTILLVSFRNGTSAQPIYKFRLNLLLVNLFSSATNIRNRQGVSFSFASVVTRKKTASITERGDKET